MSNLDVVFDEVKQFKEKHENNHESLKSSVESQLDILRGFYQEEISSLRASFKKKFTDYQISFDEKLREREDAIWTKLYYFRTFRWRILKNRGADYTRVNCISFKGGLNKSSLNHRKGQYGQFQYPYISAEQAKITYNGELDTIEHYKDVLYTKHPLPTVYIRFTEPTMLTGFQCNKYATTNNMNPWSWNMYEQQSAPEAWVFEASNNEKDWVELHKQDKSFQPCSNNPCTVTGCPYHQNMYELNFNVFG